ncbi:hypothetical protein CN902_26420 [Priestia megaterium]|uniref:hypothetical protein n=1 Tax=Priestia megaterium TaxID=1404 RepID=UPI000BFE8A4B|nr:hypothetical protein [Priestia megaterium]PGK22441.1 hypothetical protein CN902_26420 [Priestia megaterium]
MTVYEIVAAYGAHNVKIVIFPKNNYSYVGWAKDKAVILHKMLSKTTSIDFIYSMKRVECKSCWNRS